MGVPREKADAFTVPAPYTQDGRMPGRLFNAVFAPKLVNRGPSGEEVPVRVVHFTRQGNQFFLRGNAEDSLHFPSMHPLSPAERYDWYVVQESLASQPLPVPRPVGSWREDPDAVKMGFLKADDEVIAPSSETKALWERSTAAHVRDFQLKVKRYSALTLKGEENLDAAEREEAAAIRSDLARMAGDGEVPDPLGLRGPDGKTI